MIAQSIYDAKIHKGLMMFVLVLLNWLNININQTALGLPDSPDLFSCDFPLKEALWGIRFNNNNVKNLVHNEKLKLFYTNEH